MQTVSQALRALVTRQRLIRAGKVSFAVVNVACALHLTFDYVGTISATIGPSMLPTIADHGDFVLEDRISVLLNPTAFVRGELITFKSPQDPTKIVCKRIIGLPGDTVCVDPSGRQAPSDGYVLVPRGHLWVTGDNLPYSRDSRTYGPVPMGLVRSRLFARVFPFERFTLFKPDVKHIPLTGLSTTSQSS